MTHCSNGRFKRHFQQYFSYIVQSVLSVEETGQSTEKTIGLPQFTDKLDHMYRLLYRVHFLMDERHYYTITNMTHPLYLEIFTLIEQIVNESKYLVQIFVIYCFLHTFLL
jgi:hypothetical protein